MNQETAVLETQPEPPSRMLGKWMSAAMVVGSMVGSGIYLLPTTLAPFVPNLVAAFLLTGFGTMCLAFALARLAARIPGGPFAYVDRAFGEKTAFVTLWCYTFSQVTGVAGVAVAVAGALGHVYPAVISGSPLIAVALGSIVALLLVNLRGARSAGA
jgi:APA family basic amino acid/polyamine antiporter